MLDVADVQRTCHGLLGSPSTRPGPITKVRPRTPRTAARSLWVLATLTGPAAMFGAFDARAHVTVLAAVQAATFEVASIRINRDSSDRPTLLRPILQPNGRVLMTKQTVRDLIQAAYGVRDDELIGGPAWARSIGFDLEARGPADMSANTARAMLRGLLAERFSLEVHRESRQMSTYVMTMVARSGKPGPQLRPANAQCAPPAGPSGMPPLAQPPKGIADAASLMGRAALRCPSIFMPGHLSARSASLDTLATELAEAVGRPVVNRTGLTGEFDFDLRYVPELNAMPQPQAGDAQGLTTALEDQLGVKLEGSRGPVDVLVIDRLRMPTEN